MPRKPAKKKPAPKKPVALLEDDDEPINKGGRPNQIMTEGQAAALYRGVDIATADGLRMFLNRIGKAVLMGKISAERAKAVASLAGHQRALLLESNIDQRIKRIEEAAAAIDKARNKPVAGQVRDVGAPPDGMEDLRKH